MIVLDTNFVSELARPRPSQAVIEWVDADDSSDLVITALTAAEVRAGVARLPGGRRKRDVGLRMESLLTETFAGYVLAFDIESSVHYAGILAARRHEGRPISAFDTQIAAVCRQYESALGTRNTADFTDTGIQLRSPWDAPLAIRELSIGQARRPQPSLMRQRGSRPRAGYRRHRGVAERRNTWLHSCS